MNKNGLALEMINMFKKILLTGVSGQLGSNLAYLMHKEYKDSAEIVGIYNTRSARSNFIKTYKSKEFFNSNHLKNNTSFEPDLVIHCAALANIDICERRPDLATISNVSFTKCICESFPDSKIVYISTDNVYHGGSHTYSEVDETLPQNNYGRTKLLGERIVKNICDNYLILRTNIYGWDNRHNSNSFLERILDNFVKGIDNNLFYDVIYCPISINLLSEVLLECIQAEINGIYNIVGPSTTKLNFGMLISNIFGFDGNRIRPISIDDIRLDAKRPKLLNLSNKKISDIYPRINLTTYDQIDAMKLLYKSGYKEKLAKFISIGD
jgi:dTDP-4-dehydrorhamnose reductase